MGGKGSGPRERHICKDYLLYWIYCRRFTYQQVGEMVGMSYDTIGRKYRAYGLPKTRRMKVEREDVKTPPWPRGSAISELLQTYDRLYQAEEGTAKIWPLVLHMRRENG